MHAGIQDQAHFLWSALKSNGQVGAILPSGRRLGEELVRQAGVAHANRILELGAGTGAITGEILRRMNPAAEVLAIERDAALALALRSRFPTVRVVKGCASRLDEIVKREGFEQAGAVISTLPWTILDASTCEKIIQGIGRHLHEDGVFVTAVCFGLHWLPRGRWLRRRLARVARTSLVLRNFPPVLVYQCSAEALRQGRF